MHWMGAAFSMATVKQTYWQFFRRTVKKNTMFNRNISVTIFAKFNLEVISKPALPAKGCTCNAHSILRLLPEQMHWVQLQRRVPRHCSHLQDPGGNLPQVLPQAHPGQRLHFLHTTCALLKLIQLQL
jgi:hypothetical protein